MCDRYDRTCLRCWTSFVYQFVAQNYASQDLRLVHFFQTDFFITDPPYQKMTNLIFDRYLNMSMYVPYFFRSLLVTTNRRQSRQSVHYDILELVLGRQCRTICRLEKDDGFFTWFCCFCAGEFDAKVWGGLDLLDGIDFHFDVFWTRFVVI